MTTTKPDAIRKIEGLRDRAAHASTPEPEANTCLAMARKLCVKYDVDPSILDAKPITGRKPSQPTQPARRYPCTFGCGYGRTHTSEELSACADKARAASPTGSAYDVPKPDLNDLFRDLFREASRDKADSSPRRTRSHANCFHEATKAARAQCRKEGGPF